MNFSDAAKAVPPMPTKPAHPMFVEITRGVRTGEKTVDEAWAEWVRYCEASGIEPVNKEKP